MDIIYKIVFQKVSQMIEDGMPKQFQSFFAKLMKSSLFESCSCQVLTPEDQTLLQNLKKETAKYVPTVSPIISSMWFVFSLNYLKR